MPKLLSGKKVVRILCREFGFYFVSQRGSHIKLRKKVSNKNVVTIVPNHRELSPSTLRGVLELSQVKERDFWERV
jgi:predicted RNA binding protein YcfA (HicA-like mRNA interferase family)